MRHHREVETPTVAPPRNARTNGPRPSGKSATRKRAADEQTATEKPNGRALVDETKPPKANFFHRLGQMTQDDWDRHRVYIYRRWPRISRDGQPHYIAVHREALDEEAIKALYGSGRYLIKLNDARRTIDEHPLEIMDLACPPKLSPDELVDAVENEKYFKLWPPEENKKPAEGSADAAAVRELVGLLKTVIADRGKAETDDVKQTLISWALSQTARDREQNSPAALASLITSLKDVLPQQAKESRGAEKSEILAIIGALRDTQPKPQDPLAVLQQAKNLFAPTGEAAHGSDEIDRLDKVLGFAQKLAALRIPDGGGRSGWELALEAGRDIGLPLAQMIGNLMALRTTGKATAFPAAGSAGTVAPAAPVSFNPYERPDLMQAHARVMNAQAAAVAAQPASAVPGQAPPGQPANPAPIITPPPGNSDLLALLQAYGGLVVGALNNNMPGYNFAASLTDLVGTGTHAMICSHGQDSLLQAMFSIPEIAMFGETRVKRFVHEFVNYEIYQDETEDEARDAVETPAGA